MNADLLAETILREKVECNSFAWIEGQRDSVVAAMRAYYNLKQEASINASLEIIEQNNKLKEFVSRYKPNVNRYHKSREGYAEFKKDMDEWEHLMKL